MIALALSLLLPLQDADFKKLLDDLASEELEAREKAADALVKLGDKAEPELKKRLPDLAGEVKARVEAVLQRIARDRDLAKILPPLRRVTIDVKDKPMHDVFAMLTERTGLPIDTQRVGANSAITLNVKDATPLEALDAVCQAAGLSYQIDGTGVRLSPQAFADQPRVYVRHYRLAITNVQLTKSNDFRTSQVQASLDMQVMWPPDVKTESVTRFDVSSVTDDKGRALHEDPKGHMRHRLRYGTGNRAFVDHSVQMKYPEADATKIASVKGRVTVRFAVRTGTVSFAPADVGSTKDLGGAKLTLKEAGTHGAGYRIVLEVSGSIQQQKGPDDHDDPRSAQHGISYEDVRVKDQDGRELRRNLTAVASGKDGTTWRLNYGAPSGNVASIGWRRRPRFSTTASTSS